MMEKPTYRRYLWALAIVGLLLDQGSKYAMFNWLRDAPQHRSIVITDVFELVAQHRETDKGELVPYVNQGALFGLAGHWQDRANTVFAVISFLAAVAIVLWSFPKSTAQDRGLCLALGLILGGTIGNLYDRVVFGGVRDFLYCHYKDDFNWPVFNFADCCLVVGAGLLLLQAFRAQPQPASNTSTATNAEASHQAESVEVVGTSQ